ncbi:hypothetical protein PVK06_024152 [Gossypium arboreum]|uniref:Uncharacterized protein n=1 Tax=Gossypium arboreum TaxID=29729 RepID=A0ABR0PDC8_GOSAR|nr:hypothetical protein PVK06_024152 [Gossypium arboreum]
MREMTKEHARKVQELQKIAKLAKVKVEKAKTEVQDYVGYVQGLVILHIQVGHDPFDVKNINLEIANSLKEGVTAPSKDPLANPYVGNTRAKPSNVVMAP